ncbi:hypothetical protein ACFYU5_19055 [Nocardia aobensis]|uniref:Uncharacterized protein n=1 Tax=Nocardia aobensis TaxID=257277 RepID=A0ABW6P5T7_9NOCA
MCDIAHRQLKGTGYMPESDRSDPVSDLQAAQAEADLRRDRFIELTDLVAAAEGLRDIAEIKLKRATQRVTDIVSGNR